MQQPPSLTCRLACHPARHACLLDKLCFTEHPQQRGIRRTYSSEKEKARVAMRKQQELQASCWLK